MQGLLEGRWGSNTGNGTKGVQNMPPQNTLLWHVDYLGGRVGARWQQTRPSRLRSPFLHFEQFGLLECSYRNVDPPSRPSSFRTNRISLPRNNSFHSWRPVPSFLQLFQVAGFCVPSPAASLAQKPITPLCWESWSLQGSQLSLLPLPPPTALGPTPPGGRESGFCRGLGGLDFWGCWQPC